MGTFASRLTHRAGNAIIMAAREARNVMLEVAAEELEVAPEDLETDGVGNVRVMGAPQRSISVMDVALAAHFKQGRTISGRGIYLKPKSTPDPETGEMDPDSGHAHACTVAEVEVDTETGVVRVTHLVSSYEVGRAINPAMVQQQIFGGAFMGMAHALYETTAPYYPDPENAPKDWSEYILPGWGELVDMDSIILQRPLESGPCGAKGVGEMTANSPIAAIVNAVSDAIGVRITSVPITPEKVLRALDEVAER
jgi:CO/xanthine dehydrogenase Mo-binding subunit